MSKLEDELNDLKMRVQKLEEPSESKSGWEKFGNFLKMVVVPFTVMGAMLSSYDQIYLSWKESKQAEAVTAQSKLRVLEDINTEIYTLNAPGSNGRISAIYQAKAGRRFRLINEAYAFWQERGDELNRYEKQMLANELYSIQHVDEAIEIIADLKDEYVSPTEKVDIALFEGRVLGGGDPAKDIVGARKAFKRAFQNAEVLRPVQQEDYWAQISYQYLYVEMYQNSACKEAKFAAQLLKELTQRREFPVNLGVLAGESTELLLAYNDRCGLE